MKLVIEFFRSNPVSKVTVYKIGLLLGLSFLSAARTYSAATSTAPPRVFFTDLDSGPNSGGESVSGFSGAYVTLYGNFFGTNPTVTLNSASCLRVVGSPVAYLWYQKLVIQLGPSCTTGSFVVSNSQGASNGIPFTVRAGNIYFVSTSGNDSAAGTISAPWKSLHKVRNTLASGDIAYLRTGTWNSSIDSEGSSSSIIMFSGTGGSSGAPNAILNYPGETPVWSGSGKTYISYNWTGGQVHDWVFGGIRWDGAHSTSRILDGNVGYARVKFVANVVVNSSNVCWNYEGSSNTVTLFGNDISSCSPGLTDSDHGYSIYFGAYGTQDTINIGWNSLHDNTGKGKGIQMYGHAAGDIIRNVQIHHNLVYNMCAEGITLGGSDGGTAIFENSNTEYIYNNVIARNGYCEGSYGYSGLSMIGGTGNFKILNNNFYWNGNSPFISPSGDILSQGASTIEISNNIFYSAAGGNNCGYICFESATSAGITGSKNIFFHNGNGPTYLTNNINGQDPLFVANPPQPASFGTYAAYNLAIGDLHLQSVSPATDAGIALAFPQAPIDLDGTIRPQGSGMDIGAYEFNSGTTVARPNPPTNLLVVVQ